MRQGRDVVQKRQAVIEEAVRRIRRMPASEIETELAAIENGLEIRLRFIAETFKSPRAKKGLSL